jgi:hypothetical protein
LSTGVAAHDLQHCEQASLVGRPARVLPCQQQQLLLVEMEAPAPLADLDVPADSTEVSSINCNLGPAAAISADVNGESDGQTGVAGVGQQVQATAPAEHLDQLVVNVLGAPRQPAVISQRRLSFDMSTGSYMVVNSTRHHLLHRNQSSAQAVVQLQEQHQLQGPIGRSPAATFAVSPSADDQAQQDTHMQRLLAALAKKGYAGMSLPADGTGTASTDDNSCPATHRSSMHEAVSSREVGASAGLVAQQQQQLGEELGTNSAHDGGILPFMAAGAGRHEASQPRKRYCAKICDFGFSQTLRAGQSHCSGAAAGTITHQAPEMIRHGWLSPAADVYSLGIICK